MLQISSWPGMVGTNTESHSLIQEYKRSKSAKKKILPLPCGEQSTTDLMSG